MRAGKWGKGGVAVVAASGLLLWPAICAAQSAEPPLAGEGVPRESWAIHGQSTAVWLLQPGFRSASQGPQSLNAAANGRETIDVTLYAGLRLWRGAEFWIDPEIDQGFGLSDTFGLAGYASGEAYKVGKVHPYGLIQRAFLRQTIDLGGAMERLDSDLNQLAATQTVDRVVFTIGKYSVVDIFDTNRYAHDPRSDFLNWSIIDQGAFDYAANSWGLTYGVTAEWHQDWWTVRAGVFDLSTAPNSANLSRGLGQGEFVAELEERHCLAEQPGKLKLLYWLAWGHLGTYRDAIALGAAGGEAPSTAVVRRFRRKDGAGLNLEQPLTEGLGAFARASLSDGSVEELDFTDINQSLSAGLSLSGSGWGRPGDMVGLAVAVNRISHEGKLYLAAGGLGGLVGEGKLPNAGPEQILEAYYSVALFSVARFTADYQLIKNPAYNRDRGPVSIFGLRLHLAY